MTLELSPWAYARLTDVEETLLRSRAATLGVQVRAAYNSRHREWAVVASRGRTPVATLHGSGDLYAVLCGLLDDVQEVAA